MSRRPFDHEELDQPSRDADRSAAELERYAMTADADAPSGLTNRVMAAVEQESAPRRGFLAWLGSPFAGIGPGRLMRVGVVAATLVLAVAGALFGGRLAELVRDVGGNGTPTPSVSSSPAETNSVSPVPSPSAAPSSSATPETSNDNGGSGGLQTPLPTAHETLNGTPEDTPEEPTTARPSPTVTASPSPTPQPGK
jgi:hypothetical protein